MCDALAHTAWPYCQVGLYCTAMNRIVVIRAPSPKRAEPKKPEGILGLKGLTEGIALASVPVLTFLFAAAYALGRANRLEYPAPLISFTRVMVAARILPIAGVVIFFVAWTVACAVWARGPRVWRMVVLSLYIAVPLLFAVGIYPMPRRVKPMFAWGALIAAALWGLGTSRSPTRVAHASTLDTPLLGAVRANHVLVPLAAVFLVWCAYHLGSYSVEDRSEFWVVEHEGTRMAILDSDGTRAIVRVLDGRNPGACRVFDLSGQDPIFRTTLGKTERWWPPGEKVPFEVEW